LRPGGRAGAGDTTVSVSHVLRASMVRACPEDIRRDATGFAIIGMGEHVIEVPASGIVKMSAASYDDTF
jgi:hypothetical protein